MNEIFLSIMVPLLHNMIEYLTYFGRKASICGFTDLIGKNKNPTLSAKWGLIFSSWQPP
jgi:hypothetical protein